MTEIMSIYRFIVILLYFMCIEAYPQVSVVSKVAYVDPLIGTSNSSLESAGMFGKGSEECGQTIPAVLEPHGMNCWTPQTRNTEKKCIAPYYYTDSIFLGFRNSHWISGGCTQDYGSMTITPQFGILRTDCCLKGSRFSHDDEVSLPHYYSLELPDEHLKAEMTGLSSSGIFRFTYRESGKAYIVVSSNNDDGKGYVNIDQDHNSIYGCNPVHRIYQSKGESAGFSGYFIVEFSKSPIESGTFDLGAWFCFDIHAGESLMVKSSSSFCDIDGAAKNLSSEIPGWDFIGTSNSLLNIWEDYLNKIEVEGAKENLIKFYTSLYHCAFLPRKISDVDGRRPRFDNNIKHDGVIVSDSPDYYTDFSMWDTYRALHPLFNIIDRERNGKMMQSLVDMYKEGGWLPIFPCWNSYTCAMIGDHCISALTDAYVKGVRNYEVETAYNAMRKNAFNIAGKRDYKEGKGRRALKSYLRYGYIPLEDNVLDAYHTQEQVSRTLEYAYDDYCLSVMADSLGHHKDAKKLYERSKNYKNVFDLRTSYVQGRYSDGSFLSADNITERVSFITEGAPCHYSWYVPHDPEGVMALMGGEAEYIIRLDSIFNEHRYWHGNEPCHQVAYMYNFAGEYQKTQSAVREILKSEYGLGPGGLSGNDDSGAMSAWYVFSALGFYPVCPGKAEYQIGSPLFRNSVIHLENGNTFKIVVHNHSDENSFIKSIKYNGMDIKDYMLRHEMIMNGGILEIEY